MCGLAGKIGNEPAAPYLLSAIGRLEYRGYDSWGVLAALTNERAWSVKRMVGPPSDAARHCEGLAGNVGLAHNRWATHGEVSERNAHPVIGGKDPYGHDLVAVVCNGVIDNHLELRAGLEQDGYEFKTETDTESLAHFLARSLSLIQPSYSLTVDQRLLLALQRAVVDVRGRYAAVAISRAYPDVLLLICDGSPLLVYEERGLVASDVAAFEGFRGESDTAWALAEGQVGILRAGAPLAIHGGPGEREVRLPPISPSPAGPPKKPGEFMLKEIREQPAVVRAHAELPCSVFEYLEDVSLTGSGSSYHAALLGAAYLRRNGTDAHAYLPGDLRARGDVIAVTQSGETADVLRVLEPYVRQVRGEFYAVTNRPDSSVARLAEESRGPSRILRMRCGEERAVAATKSFVASCLCLYGLATDYDKSIEETRRDFLGLADAVERVLSLDISSLVESVRGRKNLFVAGQGLLYPIALEGALKCKECAYRWAEGVAFSELKHGPLALLDASGFVLGLAQSESELSLASEVSVRGCPLFLLTPENLDCPYPHLPLPLANVPEALRGLVYVVVLQLLAHALGMALGDPDRPARLAKCVSV